MSSASFEGFVNTLGRKFKREVRYHLARVYGCLAATTIAATFGAVAHISGILEAGILDALAGLGLIIGLFVVRDNGKNFYARLAMLLSFGFAFGHLLGLPLQHVISINPQIIVSALTGTCVVFVSLTASALFAERGKFLFLGGILTSILATMTLFNLVNIFGGSYYIEQGELYIGLGLMAAFILYDTQAIIEKYRMGNKDCIQHSLDLFLDLISIFQRLLIILTNKEERERKNKRKSN